MTGYQRPDDGVVPAAEMVEIKPGQSVSREAAIALGLWRPDARFGTAARAVDEIRAAALALRASEVVGEPEQPGRAEPARPPVDRAASRRRPPPHVPAPAPPVAATVPAPRPRKAKRSLQEILADSGR